MGENMPEIIVLLKFKRKSDVWLCSDCDMENDMDSGKCFLCGCRKKELDKTIIKQKESDKIIINGKEESKKYERELYSEDEITAYKEVIIAVAAVALLIFFMWVASNI